MRVELKHINEEYLKKYFPHSSVFKAYKKYTTKCNIACIVMFIFFSAAALSGLIWSGGKLFSTIVQSENDYIGIAITVFLFFLLVTAGCITMLLIMSKNARKPVRHWIDLAAKDGGYSESDIREFEKQAMESSSLVVPTAAPTVKPFRNGILTRDYICFMGGRLEVLKGTDIVSAYLNYFSFPVMGTYKSVNSLYIALIARNGKIIRTEISQKVGNVLQEVLKERYPQIDTNDGKILSEKEFGIWLDDFRNRNA